MHNFKLKASGSELKNISLTGSGLELMHDGSMLIMLLIIKDVGNLIKEKSNWWAEFHINKPTNIFSINTIANRLQRYFNTDSNL